MEWSRLGLAGDGFMSYDCFTGEHGEGGGGVMDWSFHSIDFTITNRIINRLLQLPLFILGADLHRPLLVQRDTTRMQDGRRGNGISQGRQRSRIELVQGHPPLVHCRNGINELLETDISVPGLAGEVAFFVGGVAHIESNFSAESINEGRNSRVNPAQTLLVASDIVTTLSLVNANFALRPHICLVSINHTTPVSPHGTYNGNTDSNARPPSAAPSN